MFRCYYPGHSKPNLTAHHPVLPLTCTSSLKLCAFANSGVCIYRKHFTPNLGLELIKCMSETRNRVGVHI
jgi:hypothetical protein